MQQILNTLYITTPNAYLHLENDTAAVMINHEKKMQVPLHHISSIVCFGDVMISPALMQRCASDGISLVLLDRHGHFKARLEGPVNGNILLRLAQFQNASDPIFTLNIARAIIAGKLKNSRQVLMRGARESDNQRDKDLITKGVNYLASSIVSLPKASDLDVLRGIEGDAAKMYFSCLPLLVTVDLREHFTMDGRTRRPPRDRFNALLSFLYALVMNDCRTAIESVGLDSQLGYLHSVRPGRSAMSLDLLEEFRAPLADRLALTLINRKQIGIKDFKEYEGGAVYLADGSSKKVVIAYQERKQEEITHPLTESKMCLGLVPMLQARLIARTLRGDMEGYLPFLTR